MKTIINRFRIFVFTTGFLVMISFSVWADFKILGGKFNNQQGSNTNTRFDTDNDGVDDIIMNSNANLGIGTTAPTGNIHVIGNVQIDEHMSLLSLASAPDAQSGNGLLYVVSGNLHYKDSTGNEAQLTDTTGGAWTLNSGNVYRTSGQIGIGTSDPGVRLYVSGNSKFSAGSAGPAEFVASGTSTQLYIPAGSGHEIRLNGGGSMYANGDLSFWAHNGTMTFGTGNSAGPHVKLHSNDVNPQTAILDRFASGGAFIFTIHKGSDPTTDHIFAAEFSGRIGIGTTAPSGNLHVLGNAQVDEHLSLLSLSSAPDTQSGNGLLYAVSDNLFFKDSSGNEAQITDGTSVGGWVTSEGNVYRSSGQVGVGTTSPTDELSVAGATADTTSGTPTDAPLINIHNTATGSWNTKTGLGGVTVSSADGGYTVATMLGFHALGNGQANPDAGWLFQASNNGTLVDVLRIEPGSSPGNAGHVFLPLANSQLTFGDGSVKYATIQRDSGAAGNFIFNSRRSGAGDFEFQNGLVGINAATASAQLHVQTSGASVKGLLIHGTASQSANLTEWWDGSGNLASVISPIGNLGINTSAPTGNVHVVGNVQVDEHVSLLSLSSAPDTQSGNGLLYALSDNLYYKDSNGNTSQLSDNGSVWSFDSGNVYRASGDVAIGTTEAIAGLHVVHTYENSKGQIMMRTSTGEATYGWMGTGTGGMIIGLDNGDATGGISFRTGTGVSTEKMKVHVDGNVGIGDTSPEAQLEIISASGNTFSLSSATDEDGDILTVLNDGKVGIGEKTPSANLHIVTGGTATDGSRVRGLRITNSDGGAAGAYMYDNTQLRGGLYLDSSDDTRVFGENLFFLTAGTADPDDNNEIRMTILQNGNIGIGETNPDAALEIIDGGGNILSLSSAAAGDGDYLTVDTLGNMGLGETTPTQKLVIAGNIVASSTNTYTLGTSAISWDNIYAKDYTMISDLRLKDNIRDLKPGLGAIMKLRPVSYSWKGDSPRERQYGLIAQEVQQVLSDAVNVGEDTNQTLGVHYTNLVPVLIKAVQEQQREQDGLNLSHTRDKQKLQRQEKRIEELDKRLLQQQKANAELRALIQAMQKRLDSLK